MSMNQEKIRLSVKDRSSQDVSEFDSTLWSLAHHIARVENNIGMRRRVGCTYTRMRIHGVQSAAGMPVEQAALHTSYDLLVWRHTPMCRWQKEAAMFSSNLHDAVLVQSSWRTRGSKCTCHKQRKCPWCSKALRLDISDRAAEISLSRKIVREAVCPFIVFHHQRSERGTHVDSCDARGLATMKVSQRVRLARTCNHHKKGLIGATRLLILGKVRERRGRTRTFQNSWLSGWLAILVEEFVVVGKRFGRKARGTFEKSSADPPD
ncbi:hypothetical protein HDK90DRAFT_35237 [Phyllosticta capitalensis]|uniref:Uncharacterized protein n=1 Tax=Phyllosticta capitalensis TaxID=121624 RepID=A0ABR1Z483_9PEZI